MSVKKLAYLDTVLSNDLEWEEEAGSVLCNFQCEFWNDLVRKADEGTIQCLIEFGEERINNNQ